MKTKLRDHAKNGGNQKAEAQAVNGGDTCLVKRAETIPQLRSADGVADVPETTATSVPSRKKASPPKIDPGSSGTTPQRPPLSLESLDKLIIETERSKVDDEQRSKMLADINIILTKPLTNLQVGEALDRLCKTAAFVRCGFKAWDGFCQRVFGWLENTGLTYLRLFQDGKWSEVIDRQVQDHPQSPKNITAHDPGAAASLEHQAIMKGRQRPQKIEPVVDTQQSGTTSAKQAASGEKPDGPPQPIPPTDLNPEWDDRALATAKKESNSPNASTKPNGESSEPREKPPVPAGKPIESKVLEVSANRPGKRVRSDKQKGTKKPSGEIKVAADPAQPPGKPSLGASIGVPNGNPPPVLKDHPLAAAFPLLDDDDLAELAEDIRIHGLQDPIVKFEGKILDGRNRYRSCMKTGVAPSFTEYNGSAPVQFVLSKNLQRRNLTPSQRAATAVELLPLLEKEAKERKDQTKSLPRDEKGMLTKKPEVEKTPQVEPETQKGDTQNGPKREKVRDKAAKTMGVNSHYVSDAKRIKEFDQVLFEKVKNGKATLASAKRTLAKANQTEAANTEQKKPTKSKMPFDEADAWQRVEEFLLNELKSWPKSTRAAFADQLEKFAIEKVRPASNESA